MMEQVKTLRTRTGAGIIDCKKALQEAQNDMEKAIEYLRKKGLSDMAKRAERSTNESRAECKISNDGKLAVMAGVNCETDFVAKTDDFKKIVSDIVNYALANPDIKDFGADDKIKEMITAIAPKLGENITLKDVIVYKLKGNGALNYYIHSDNKKSAIVEINCDDKIAGKTQELKEIAKELALQTVAMIPSWVKKEDVPAGIIEKEKDIYRTQAKESGKPEQAIEKMAEGKLRKFFEHVCLIEQASVREPKTKVTDYLKKKAEELGGEIKVIRFNRF